MQALARRIARAKVVDAHKARMRGGRGKPVCGKRKFIHGSSVRGHRRSTFNRDPSIAEEGLMAG
jgi:hypothetical protein